MRGWIVVLVICAITAGVILGLYQIKDQHIDFSTPPCVGVIVSCP